MLGVKWRNVCTGLFACMYTVLEAQGVLQVWVLAGVSVELQNSALCTYQHAPSQHVQTQLMLSPFILTHTNEHTHTPNTEQVIHTHNSRKKLHDVNIKDDTQIHATHQYPISIVHTLFFFCIKKTPTEPKVTNWRQQREREREREREFHQK